MKTVRQRTKMAIVAVMTLLMTALWSAQALAGVVTLTLVRTSTLTNVSDAAGVWQHESGNVLKGAVVVGQYALHRRVTTPGTSAQNVAMETITLFFSTPVSSPPQNVTLQGAHDFDNGRFVGSVSAASNRHNWIQGADATMTPTAVVGTSTLGIAWAGANQLTLP